MSNSLDLDQARHFQTGQNVRLDLVPNCLKRLSADDNVMKRFNAKLIYVGSTSTCHNLLSVKQFGPLSGPDRMSA